MIDPVDGHRRMFDMQLLTADVDIPATGRFRPVTRPADDRYRGRNCHDASQTGWSESGHSRLESRETKTACTLQD